MTPDTIPNAASLLTSRIKVPQHVVYRSFPSETVVLNLQTGATTVSTRPRAACWRRWSVRPACATRWRGSRGLRQPQGLVERDVCELCTLLLERGMIELDGQAP